MCDLLPPSARERADTFASRHPYGIAATLVAFYVGLFLLLNSSCIPKIPFIPKTHAKIIPNVVLPMPGIPEPFALERAMDYWNCILGATAFTRRAGGDIVQIELVDELLRVEHVGDALHELREWSRLVTRELDRDGIFYLMQLASDVATISPESIETVYRHELGHVLGLPGHEGEGVMSHVMSESMGLRVASVDEQEYLLDKHNLRHPGYLPKFCSIPDPGDAPILPTTGVRR